MGIPIPVKKQLYIQIAPDLFYWYVQKEIDVISIYWPENMLLSHPSLGWLYVFSSFPPPQWLLLLMSKPFELDLRYLGQRKYRSGKTYWMTFQWPWPKVMAVALININLLVCRIKWEWLNQSLQNMVAISLWSCLLPDKILEGFRWKLVFWQTFIENFGCVFWRSNTRLYISQEWLIRLIRNEKEVHWLGTG